MLKSLFEAQADYRLVMDALAAPYMQTITEDITTAIKEGYDRLEVPISALSSSVVRALMHVLQRKNYTAEEGDDYITVSGWADL
jgi:hypothetical protein